MSIKSMSLSTFCVLFLRSFLSDFLFLSYFTVHCCTNLMLNKYMICNSVICKLYSCHVEVTYCIPNDVDVCGDGLCFNEIVGVLPRAFSASELVKTAYSLCRNCLRMSTCKRCMLITRQCVVAYSSGIVRHNYQTAKLHQSNVGHSSYKFAWWQFTW